MAYITKGIGGFYYVKTPDGIVECKARGIFRKSGIKPVAGDWVELSPDGTVIDENTRVEKSLTLTALWRSEAEGRF